MFGIREHIFSTLHAWCNYRQTFNILRAESQNLIFFVSSCSCHCPIYWSQVLSRKWWYSWSSDDTLQWRHNGHGSVTNHQPHHCLLNGSFRRRSKKSLKLCVTGLCAGNSPGPVNSPYKWPVTRKMFCWRRHAGDAPFTSQRSIDILPIKVRFILEVGR